MSKLIVSAVAYIVIISVAFALFSGCVKYVDKEVLVPYEVQVPVPKKCEYQMPAEIKPNLSNLQAVYRSLTEILQGDRELRNSLRQIPCLEIK